MSTTLERTMLVLTDGSANSNKFYEVTAHADGRVIARWGRVGQSGNITDLTGKKSFDRAVHDKTRKGYRPVELVDGACGAAQASADVLRTVGRDKLAGGNTAIAAMVDRLVAVTAHTISSASGGKITVTSTGVQTALGPVSSSAISQARNLLDRMHVMTSGTDRVRLVNDYLMLIPQTVPSRGAWADHFVTGDAQVRQQRDLLDQLEAAVAFTAAPDSGDDDFFRYTLVPATAAELKTLRARYVGTKNAKHRGVSSATMSGAYRLIDNRRSDEIEQTIASVGNVRSMWHGSRAGNVLSILSSGLVVPPATAKHVTARMFGDGVYLSEQSSKSLQYSRGGVWSAGTDPEFFMFAADVAMGWEYRPNMHGQSHAAYDRARSGSLVDNHHEGRRFDSINVKGGTCGVLNHEAIIWRPDQVKLTFLCQFGG
ncbi:WGR domain-containing protein [Yimella lutea]|nr:WGR domain-containing protein [Yimella lutea]